jgi:hypothetical protein
LVLGVVRSLELSSARSLGSIKIRAIYIGFAQAALPRGGLTDAINVVLAMLASRLSYPDCFFEILACNNVNGFSCKVAVD